MLSRIEIEELKNYLYQIVMGTLEAKSLCWWCQVDNINRHWAQTQMAQIPGGNLSTGSS